MARSSEPTLAEAFSDDSDFSAVSSDEGSVALGLRGDGGGEGGKKVELSEKQREEGSRIWQEANKKDSTSSRTRMAEAQVIAGRKIAVLRGRKDTAGVAQAPSQDAVAPLVVAEATAIAGRKIAAPRRRQGAGTSASNVVQTPGLVISAPAVATHIYPTLFLSSFPQPDPVVPAPPSVVNPNIDPRLFLFSLPPGPVVAAPQTVADPYIDPSLWLFTLPPPSQTAAVAQNVVDQGSEATVLGVGQENGQHENVNAMGYQMDYSFLYETLASVELQVATGDGSLSEDSWDPYEDDDSMPLDGASTTTGAETEGPSIVAEGPSVVAGVHEMDLVYEPAGMTFGNQMDFISGTNDLEDISMITVVRTKDDEDDEMGDISGTRDRDTFSTDKEARDQMSNWEEPMMTEEEVSGWTAEDVEQKKSMSDACLDESPSDMTTRSSGAALKTIENTATEEVEGKVGEGNFGASMVKEAEVEEEGGASFMDEVEDTAGTCVLEETEENVGGFVVNEVDGKAGATVVVAAEEGAGAFVVDELGEEDGDFEVDEEYENCGASITEEAYENFGTSVVEEAEDKRGTAMVDGSEQKAGASFIDGAKAEEKAGAFVLEEIGEKIGASMMEEVYKKFDASVLKAEVEERVGAIAVEVGVGVGALVVNEVYENHDASMLDESEESTGASFIDEVKIGEKDSTFVFGGTGESGGASVAKGVDENAGAFGLEVLGENFGAFFVEAEVQEKVGVFVLGEIGENVGAFMVDEVEQKVGAFVAEDVEHEKSIGDACINASFSSVADESPGAALKQIENTDTSNGLTIVCSDETEAPRVIELPRVEKVDQPVITEEEAGDFVAEIEEKFEGEFEEIVKEENIEEVKGRSNEKFKVGIEEETPITLRTIESTGGSNISTITSEEETETSRANKESRVKIVEEKVRIETDEEKKAREIEHQKNRDELWVAIHDKKDTWATYGVIVPPPTRATYGVIVPPPTRATYGVIVPPRTPLVMATLKPVVTNLKPVVKPIIVAPSTPRPRIATWRDTRLISKPPATTLKKTALQKLAGVATGIAAGVFGVGSFVKDFVGLLSSAPGSPDGALSYMDPDTARAMERECEVSGGEEWWLEKEVKEVVVGVQWIAPVEKAIAPVTISGPMSARHLLGVGAGKGVVRGGGSEGLQLGTIALGLLSVFVWGRRNQHQLRN